MANLQKIKVLIVDDYVNFAWLMRHGLEVAGFVRVDAATSAVEALNLLRAGPYDVLVTDLHMPSLDGVSLIREVRKDRVLYELPILALTGYLDKKYQQQAVDAGADKILLKPVSIGTLHDEIKRLLADHRAKDGAMAVSSA